MAVCNDGVLTPVSDCRYFDFTVTFSNVLFAILPSCLAFVLIAARLVRICRKPDLPTASAQPRLSLLRSCTPHSDPVSLFGAFVYVTNAILSLALIGLLASPSSTPLREAMGDRTGMTSVVLTFLTAILAIPLSVAERRKTRGGNMVLPLWLLFTLLFNACRIRTFNAIPTIRHSSFFSIYILAFGFQALMLAAENAKGILTVDINSTHESRASFFSRLLFIWVFPLLWSGFRKPLELADLDSLKPDFYGRHLAQSFIASWTGASIGTKDDLTTSDPSPFDTHADLKRSPSRSSINAYPLEKLATSHSNSSTAATSPKHAPLYNGNPFPKRQNKRGILSATLLAFPLSTLAPVPWKLLLTACELAQPLLVSTTLAFVQSYSGVHKDDPASAQPVVYGWGLVGAYAFIYLGQTLATGQYWYASSQVMTKIRGAYVEAVYRKGLNLHVRTARTSGGGKAANLMSVDSERVVKAVDVIHALWSGIITIAIGVYLLFNTLGLVFFAPMVSVFICFFLTPLASRGIGGRQAAWSAMTDKRVNLTSSVTSDIKGVKFSAYENVIHENFCKTRADELARRSNVNKLITGVVVFSNSTGEMLGVATFITLIIVDKLSGSNRFNLNTIFTTLTIFGILQAPLLQIGQQYSYLLQAWASMKRIEDFLNSEDKPDLQQAIHDELAGLATTGDAPYAAKFENADLGWDREVVLSNVNLEIPQGSLTMICGRLGQGKSTLLQAILGESDLINGQQRLPLLSGRTAYVSQDVWLQEKRSIRENIVFATGEYDEERYITALKACALTEDIETLQEGDSTTASALSGGQRQRLAVARAIYSEAESYLFDDITSALDAETAAHMWRSLMGHTGLLKGKTVVMVTNAVHLLHHTKLVVRIDAGKVAEQGRYEQLSMKGKDAISRASLDSSRVKPAEPAAKDKAIKTGAAEKQETVMTGSVGWRVYATWFRAAGRWKVYLFFACAVFANVSTVGGSYYLQAWTKAQQKHRLQAWGAWLGGYVCLILFNPLFLAIGFWIFNVNCAESAGNRLHAAELRGVLSAPISFFSKWSSGQITNRFSQDLFNVDQVFTNAITNSVFVALSFLAALVTMIVPALYLAVLGVVLIAASWAMQRLYIPSSRQLRRLEMAAKSPSTHCSRRRRRHRASPRFTEVEIAGVALERVREFADIEPEQKVLIGQQDDKDKDEDSSTTTITSAIRGDINFDKVTVSYGPELEPAVKELSFDLRAGKRLGLCGRSGSGKSTTLLALFRMIEMCSGTIRIDSKDITGMSARKLRSQMTIVAQNPLVLAATIRENLDPEGLCTEDELWDAVRKCDLADFVNKQESKLDTLLLTGDTFISSGQKQLLSLARALLRKRRILVLDEATSAMDVETDAAVQNVLSTQFADCTVIAVAHRIATIIDFDQIICMSAGRAIETGSPQELLQKRGEFWALAAEQKCV